MDLGFSPARLPRDDHLHREMIDDDAEGCCRQGAASQPR